MEAKESDGHVRFAVYGSLGNFLGYKADTFWTLSKKEKYAKPHPAKDAGSSSHLFRNLLDFLNNEDYVNRELAKKGHLDDRQSLYVIAEDIVSGEIISHVSIKNMAIKKYELIA